jgi:hypothetical protein
MDLHLKARSWPGTMTHTSNPSYWEGIGRRTVSKNTWSYLKKQRKQKRAAEWLKWWSTSPASMRPWVQTPVLPKMPEINSFLVWSFLFNTHKHIHTIYFVANYFQIWQQLEKNFPLC